MSDFVAKQACKDGEAVRKVSGVQMSDFVAKQACKDGEAVRKVSGVQMSDFVAKQACKDGEAARVRVSGVGGATQIRTVFN